MSDGPIARPHTCNTVRDTTYMYYTASTQTYVTAYTFEYERSRPRLPRRADPQRVRSFNETVVYKNSCTGPIITGII
jgi:hypothetical protein